MTNPTRALQPHRARPTQLGVEADGFAPALYWNDGVQYGLAALEDGTIGVDAFLDLNAGIGGYDRNGKPQAERSLPDPGRRPGWRRRSSRRPAPGDWRTRRPSTCAATPTCSPTSTRRTGRWPSTSGWWPTGSTPASTCAGSSPPGVNRQGDALDAMEAWLTAIEADHRRGLRPCRGAQPARRRRPTGAGRRPRRPRSRTSRPATPDRSRSPPTPASWPAARSPATWCARGGPDPSRRTTR